ncbi:Glutaredoxin [Penicillium riverlandense]|uniref:Glutaredoxin n=1 Tax=Penicillium riverlandense TaxID=1903569 RepID=UPI0025480432|nr:Glutaredoxin [Penicillium riverlandense]KAJ5818928.1 Glutaredoxin [Penicillium riverlandense]
MSDSTLYLFTSLTAGSSHIVTATARLETILKANKLPFKALDVATDEAARKLWGRRAKGKKLPGLVKYGTVVGDLEQIEEWNEFGELRMEVNNVQDLDGVPATAPAPVDTQAANNQTESEPATPKPSTIKIQSPPANKTAEKKDEQAVLALRQASSEAAAKAKNKSEETKKEVSSAEPTTKVDTEEAESKPLPVHRRSVAPELPDTAPGSPKVAKRPPLVPEVAAQSSANFHADNAEALGLVQHHRGSIISAGDKAEQEKAVHVIRQSVSKDEPDMSLDELRKEAAQKADEGTIEETIEEPQPSAEETKDDTQDEDKGESKEEPKATDPAPKEDSQPDEGTKAAE